MSVLDSSPASKAGIEEGNRIAAIGGVNLRVSREDAGDRYLSSTKAQRLQREIAALKPGENVTLKVYSNGQFRDVSLKVARVGDLPKSSGMMFLNGDGFIGGVPMPAMPSMPSMPRIAPMPSFERFEYEMPELQRSMDRVRVQLRDIAPQMERIERIAPGVQMHLDAVRPQLERLRMMAPRMMTAPRVILTPRMRMVHVTV